MTGWTLLAAGAAAVAAATLLPGPPPAVPPAGLPSRVPRGGPDASGLPSAHAAEHGLPRPARWVAAAGAGLGLAVLVGHLPGAAAGAVAAAVAWVVTGRMESPAARRRRTALTSALPHVVDLLAACLAVGLAPSTAVRQVVRAVGGPVAEELGQVLARLDFGVDPATAWRDLGRHPQLGVLGRTLARSVESGASVAEAMTRLAEDLRRDGRARVEATARTVGVHAAVPLGVCLLPAFLLVGVVPLVVGSLPLVLGR